MKKHTLLFIVLFLLFLPSCVAPSSDKNRDSNPKVVEVESVEEELYVAEEPTDKREDAQQRYQGQLEKKSNDKNIAVVYADGTYIWYVYRKDDGYKNPLWVYNSIEDNVADINMNKTDLPDDEVYIQAFTENGGKISVIMEEMRNSDGWVEGTSVWTFDTSNRRWKPVAQGVSGAEFVKNGSAVKITEAKDLTPDEPTFAKEYSYSYRTITL